MVTWLFKILPLVVMQRDARVCQWQLSYLFGIYRQKNFENRPAFAEFMIKNLVYCFLNTMCVSYA